MHVFNYIAEMFKAMHYTFVYRYGCFELNVVFSIPFVN